MATLVLRNVKGSPLTSVEMDGNLSGLNDEFVTSGSMTGTKEITLVTRGETVADVTVDTTPMYDALNADATALAIALG
jgi:hypothetical protein